MRRLFAVAIALALLTGCGNDDKKNATVTSVNTFAPWKADGTVTSIDVKSQSSGACFSASGSVDGAYRCFVGTEIQDPCFAPPDLPNTNRVACAVDPWSDLTLVTLTAKLPEVAPAAGENPHWAIELENNDRCVSLGVAGIASDGVTMPYSCKSKSTASDFSKGSQPWTVQYNKNNISFDLASVKVVAAW